MIFRLRTVNSSNTQRVDPPGEKEESPPPQAKQKESKTEVQKKSEVL